MEFFFPVKNIKCNEVLQERICIMHFLCKKSWVSISKREKALMKYILLKFS